MHGWIIIGIAFLYLILLFAVASIGDRKAFRWGAKPRPYIYAFSLAVYCTSWTFFGSVGLAANRGLEFLGIYIGPILVFTFGNKFLRHVVRLAKAERITSIADFLAARYGKSTSVATIGTCIAVVGSMPYIALQLKAVSGSVDMVLAQYQVTYDPIVYVFGDISLFVTALLAIFAILFGTRHTDATEHQDGLILAVALESVIKIAAFLIVGIATTFFLFGSPFDLPRQLQERNIDFWGMISQTSASTWIVHTVLSAAAILMLPRQFHVTVVENRSEKELRTARWLFPVYLILINLFVLPIALQGIINLGPATNADLYVLALPLAANSHLLTLLAFVGGLSAATAMVIVACVALSIMISNHLLLPLLIRYVFRRNKHQQRDLTRLILYTRRATIVIILAVTFSYYRASSSTFGLASIGLVSFAAIAQFAPPLIGGLIWRNANARGAVLGMVSGFAVWAYTLLLPTLANPDAPILRDGLWGLSYLRPQALFGVDALPLTHGALWSLAVNALFFVIGSLSRQSTPLERIQASTFMPRNLKTVPVLRRFRTSVTVGEIKNTIARYLGEDRVALAFSRYDQNGDLPLDDKAVADVPLIRFAEQILGSAIGSSSARLVLSLLLQRKDNTAPDTLRLLDDASEALQHNRDLLQTALDQMQQGITVLDKDFRLTCWNRRFRYLLQLPDGFAQVGTPISDVLDLLLQNGEIHASDGSAMMRTLERAHEPSRILLHSTGKIIEIAANPMPDGGIVASYTDITASVEADNAMKRLNETLEQRVADRTTELLEVNQQLVQAQKLAEEANFGKTRFLAAAGHDILQPLNAARLYSTALSERLGVSEAQLARNIDSSLEAVEGILSALLDISRLDTGALKPELTLFRLDRLLQQVATDFTPLAVAKGLKLRIVPCSLTVYSDRNLLRRLLQNLVSNSIKYSRSGKILLGVRRRGGNLEIKVADTGIGIAPEKQQLVFREFYRLDEGISQADGLGLGLSIVDRIVRVLHLTIHLQSQHGKGTCFSVIMPVSQEPAAEIVTEQPQARRRSNALQGMRVLCIDNDPLILDGMRTLLGGWGCDMTLIRDGAQLKDWCNHISRAQTPVRILPDIILADYHLNRENGLDMIGYTREMLGHPIPAVLLTADRSKEVKLRAQEDNVHVLNKPIKPAALRSLLAHYHLR
ncbi:PAS domain-containing hybrid sensor histidine kinase/response regulator [Pseudochrobactrum sp. sp1633]|uniref:PAS domain-containing hybrid sensor histidine kinase/response regulator n=1 Tax=Pseudochrobactrum sp. sp1633 TaxID=3036706 RepID=UPI0025A5AEB6|nr:PAS domain-containing hybrid sensor histidine kinase/response regulator [Pseudochrobactrum sp. sp1633]MDM8346514.1 PAS domain-containing hybrid sensor histidine kinase/response regulator [Pseudochrobactrum sp. sp1633]